LRRSWSWFTPEKNEQYPLPWFAPMAVSFLLQKTISKDGVASELVYILEKHIVFIL